MTNLIPCKEPTCDLRESGYNVLRMDGSKAIGFFDEYNIYYELVVRDGKIQWFVDDPIINFDFCNELIGSF